MSDPYTQSPMEPARALTDVRDSRFDGLHEEATAAVGYSANTLRSVRERYHQAYSETLGHWQSLRDELDLDDRAPNESARPPSSTAPVDRAADAAEAGADDARRRALRGDVDALTMDSATTRPSSPSWRWPNGRWSAPGSSSSAAMRPF
jgi:hypothetical protein